MAPNVASQSPPTERFATDMVVGIDNFPITTACPTRQYLKSQWTHTQIARGVFVILLGQCVLHRGGVQLNRWPDPPSKPNRNRVNH